MKRLFCVVIIIIMFLFPLTSCKAESLLKTNSPHLLLTACVYYSVPGFYQFDLKGNCAEVVDVDDYGRTLVSFEGYNWLTGKQEIVYVVCQKYNDSTIYFYEDSNYTWSSKSIVNLETLKKENDWNSVIDESKFSARRINVSFDLCLVNDSPFLDFSNERFYLSLSEICDISRETVASVAYCDWDGQNQALYLIVLNNDEKLFCIVDVEYNIFTAKIDDPYNFSDAMRSLKQKSNWFYGF